MKRITTSDDRRSGVILMVVLAMLALLSLVGITFVLAADAAQPANQPFQREVDSLITDTRDLAFSLSHDLASFDDDTDLGAYPEAIRSLSARAEDLRVRIHRAYDSSTDPRARNDLRTLERRLEEFRSCLCLVREFIELIIQRF